jgi:hypothetical protein
MAARSTADVLPPRYLKTLTKIDRRGRLGKRITELTKLFTTAVDGVISPLRKMRIQEAAQLKALAEQARGEFMRDGKGALEDIVPLERRAEQAVRAIGLNEAKRRPGRPGRSSIRDYLDQAKDARE